MFRWKKVDSLLLSSVLAATAALAVHRAVAQEKQNSLKKAQALLGGQSGKALLSPSADRPKPLPEKVTVAGKFRPQSLTRPQAGDLLSVSDVNKVSLPAGKNRAAIPGITHNTLTANRADEPVDLKGLPPVPASKLRSDVHPNLVPLP